MKAVFIIFVPVIFLLASLSQAAGEEENRKLLEELRRHEARILKKLGPGNTSPGLEKVQLRIERLERSLRGQGLESDDPASRRNAKNGFSGTAFNNPSPESFRQGGYGESRSYGPYGGRSSSDTREKWRDQREGYHVGKRVFIYRGRGKYEVGTIELQNRRGQIMTRSEVWADKGTYHLKKEDFKKDDVLVRFQKRDKLLRLKTFVRLDRIINEFTDGSIETDKGAVFKSNFDRPFQQSSEKGKVILVPVGRDRFSVEKIKNEFPGKFVQTDRGLVNLSAAIRRVETPAIEGQKIIELDERGRRKVVVAKYYFLNGVVSTEKMILTRESYIRPVIDGELVGSHALVRQEAGGFARERIIAQFLDGSVETERGLLLKSEEFKIESEELKGRKIAIHIGPERVEVDAVRSVKKGVFELERGGIVSLDSYEIITTELKDKEVFLIDGKNERVTGAAFLTKNGSVILDDQKRILPKENFLFAKPVFGEFYIRDLNKSESGLERVSYILSDGSVFTEESGRVINFKKSYKGVMRNFLGRLGRMVSVEESRRPLAPKSRCAKASQPVR